MKVLLVGEIPGGTQAWGAFHAAKASTPKLAARFLEAMRPDVVVVWSAGWGSQWVADLPPERRPPVLLVGPLSDGVVAPDEWVGSVDSRTELELRLRLAVLRGRERRRTARRAMVDPLTALPNRRAAIRALVHAGARAKRGESFVSLVLIDLDHFKTINDTLGHDAGDRVLRKVGAVLTRVVRHDELCARIGGDEFALLIHAPVGAARSAARRVRAALLEAGVEATLATAQLQPGERLRDFYRRTDERLKAKKSSRRGPTPPSASGFRLAA